MFNIERIQFTFCENWDVSGSKIFDYDFLTDISIDKVNNEIPTYNQICKNKNMTTLKISPSEDFIFIIEKCMQHGDSRVVRTTNTRSVLR